MRHLLNDTSLQSVRKLLRVQQTDHERLLWGKLRGRQLNGHKFYRQYSVEKYVLDFYCPMRKLAIELDGSQHGEEKGVVRDKERDAFLSTHSIRVLRFWNHEVKANLFGVQEAILHALDES